MTEQVTVVPHGRASASEPAVDGVPGAQPPNVNGMTAASCVLRWGGGLDD
jgi:hypothetical protein